MHIVLLSSYIHVLYIIYYVCIIVPHTVLCTLLYSILSFHIIIEDVVGSPKGTSAPPSSPSTTPSARSRIEEASKFPLLLAVRSGSAVSMVRS